jgi:hypothetical protein
MPVLASAALTLSTRAMVVRGGPSYTLAPSDFAVVHPRVLLGSEAVARSEGALRAAGVCAIVNCAGNSVPLPQAQREACGAAQYCQLQLVDAAHVEGQDALALIERGQVVAGVLGCPNLGQDFARSFNDPDLVGTLFYATRDGGAWSLAATDTADRAQRIHVANGRPITDLRMCESVESGHSRLDSAHQIRTRLRITGEPARLDSQCKYAVVARGQADAYLRLPTRHDYVEKIWDHAAGALIATEAGAKVTDIHGKALDFSTGTGLTANKGVVCASASHHAALLDAIAALED